MDSNKEGIMQGFRISFKRVLDVDNGIINEAYRFAVANHSVWRDLALLAGIPESELAETAKGILAKHKAA